MRIIILCFTFLAIASLACKSSGGGASPAATPAGSPTNAPPAVYTAEIEAAIPAYAAAVATPDGAYLFDHLHSTALHFYGVETCRAWFATVGGDPTFALDVHSVTGPAPWTWAVYGETIATIPDVYIASVAMTRSGVASEVETHFTWNAEEGEVRGFSPCISPPA